MVRHHKEASYSGLDAGRQRQAMDSQVETQSVHSATVFRNPQVLSSHSQYQPSSGTPMKQHFNNEYMSPKTKNSVKKLQQIPEQAHTYAAKKKGSEKLKKEKSQNPSESHSIVKEKQKTSRMAQKIADEKQAS